MPIAQIDRTDKCYRSKDDRLHATIFYRGDLSRESHKEREERLKNIHESKGRWVWDNGKLVRAEDYYSNQSEVEAPKVGKWNEEWAVLGTGRRMSKSELKRYCVQNHKEWIN